MIYLFNKSSYVQVGNTTHSPNIVVLLPITRTTIKAQKNWLKILEILDNSKVSSLVILDKTPNEEATTFFKDSFRFEFMDLYIIRRPPDEPIYDSQKFITLDRGLWILQLHDDDEWDGSLSIPENAQDFDLFTTNFYVINNSKSEYIKWENSPPARINFTLIPSQIWNHFVKFIDSQGGHVAGSVDSTLNLVSRLICFRKSLSSFSYYYDDRHWRNRSNASKNLINLAAQDGWSELASVEIQIMNRNIDNLVAVSFFQEFISTKTQSVITSELLRSFRPSLKRRLITLLKFSVYTICKVLVYFLEKINTLIYFKQISYYLESRQKLYRLVMKSWKIRKSTDILKLIYVFENSIQHPSLSARFVFWKSILNT